jgi:hypothetical protein
MKILALALPLFLALGGCVASGEPIPHAERAVILAPILGPETQCIDRAQTNLRYDRDRAVASCGCLRSAIVNGLSDSTVRLVKTDVMPSQSVLARVSSEMASVTQSALRECGFPA